MARSPAGPKSPLRSPPSPLVLALDSPRILASLVAHLSWPDLLALLNTCSRCRKLFLFPDHRDAILARFVPLYADALRLRNTANYHALPLSIRDLDLLLISNNFPLHRYPTHALKILTALYPTLEDDYVTTKLTRLSQAHTRFVLLLQALVHSSSSPIPPERDDFRRRSHRHSTLSSLSSSGPLEFPAPLSYLKEQAAHADPPVDSTSVSEHLTRRSEGDSDISRSPAVGLIINKIQESRLSRQSSKIISKCSFLKKTSLVSPPLPESEPHALRIYSSYRKPSASNTNRLSRLTSVNDFGLPPAPIDIKRSKHRLTPSVDSSTSSSPLASSPLAASPLASSPLASSSILPQTRAGERSPIRHTSRPTSSSHSSISTASPHDLSMAISRIRAPVLRVFVPCTTMDFDSESVLLCERQLVKAGLWQYLSIGDVVCNLGYIPPTSEDTFTTSTEEESAWSRGGNNTRDNSRKWLVFDGTTLVPYTTSSALPLEHPISLPSPYYYAHLMPNTTPLGNPNQFRFLVGKFPPVKHQTPQLSMVNLPCRVRSRKSPDGWVEVRRWVWTARFFRYRPTMPMDLSEEVGTHWLGEWVLEGAGTSEGRQMLLDILDYGTVPGGPREWELVRERSGGGQIWLRLIT